MEVLDDPINMLKEDFGLDCDLEVVYGKMMINSAALADSKMNQHIGTAIYLDVSVFDHSCAPNAQWSFEGNEIVVRAMENVDSFEGRGAFTLGLSNFS